uniref:Cathepsin L1-like protein n=1 Tax=Callorhinchus milii TaxID=7868 RepID=V9LGJ3_CALMI
MKISVFLGSFVVLVVTTGPALAFDEALTQAWEQWKAFHQREYTEIEESSRRLVWEKNLHLIERHNLEYSMGQQSFRLRMNMFGDMTVEEFNWQMNGFGRSPARTSSKTFLKVLDPVQLPRKIDWRKEGYVTPIKNQVREENVLLKQLNGSRYLIKYSINNNPYL